MDKYPKSRQSNLVVQELENELLIYDLQINSAYCLNQTSAMIWQLCDGKNSVSEISRSLANNLKTRVPEELIWLALDQLKRNNLLEKSADFAIDFGGLNRRQIIKKVGFASMIALPLINSVVAPEALMAQSGACSSPVCSNGDCCPSPGTCYFVNIFTTACCTSGIVCSPQFTFDPQCCAPGLACVTSMTPLGLSISSCQPPP